MAKKQLKEVKVKEVKVETNGACKDAEKESNKPKYSLARRLYLRKKRRNARLAKKK
jgi:hypothetical protein